MQLRLTWEKSAVTDGVQKGGGGGWRGTYGVRCRGAMAVTVCLKTMKEGREYRESMAIKIIMQGYCDTRKSKGAPLIYFAKSWF